MTSDFRYFKFPYLKRMYIKRGLKEVRSRRTSYLYLHLFILSKNQIKFPRQYWLCFLLQNFRNKEKWFFKTLLYREKFSLRIIYLMQIKNNRCLFNVFMHLTRKTSNYIIIQVHAPTFWTVEFGGIRLSRSYLYVSTVTFFCLISE